MVMVFKSLIRTRFENGVRIRIRILDLLHVRSRIHIRTGLHRTSLHVPQKNRDGIFFSLVFQKRYFTSILRRTPQCAMSFTVNKTSISLTIDESENKLLSGDLTVCVVCARKFICLHVFLFAYVCMWHIPISSWEVIKLRPSLSHQRLKNAHVHETRWCLQWPRTVFMWHVSIFSCVHTQESRGDPRSQAIFWVRRTTIVTEVLHTLKHIADLDVCATWKSVL